MNKLYKLLAACLLFPAVSMAQSEDIETDRPSESINPSVVLKNHFQVEAGFRREHKDNEGQKHLEYLYPSALLKYGVTKKLELDVPIEDEADYDFTPNKQRTAYGLQPIKIGIKYNLWDEKGALPKTTLVARADVPKWASPDFKSDFVAPTFRLAMENSLTEKLKLEYNAGAEWEEDDVHGRFLYSVCPQFEITDKFHVFAEYYGYVSKSSPSENVIDAGLLYKLKTNIQLDVFGGFGLSKMAPKNFIEAGFSFRLPR